MIEAMDPEERLQFLEEEKATEEDIKAYKKSSH